MDTAMHKTVAALHQEGNQFFDEGNYAEAARMFRSAIDRFQSDRRSDKAAVEEFVKVAGNLCVCHHAMGNWNTCVSTARELLAMYPVIPKAYAAIGMCIVSRLLHQEAEQQNEDVQNSPNMPPRSGEEVRRDSRRYLVKLGGVLCTPDDAHSYLCRAILLSGAQLQVSLGPYLETAVRWVSEELLSAGLSLERELGDGVLGQLSALETSLGDVPPLLDTAPVLFERQTIRVLDAAAMQANAMAGSGAAAGVAASRRIEELPEAEAESILRTIREGQELAGGASVESGEEGSGASTEAASDGRPAPPVKPPLEPIDFLLSRQRIAVRVCHAERGGIPRGLTLARSAAPFAVAQDLQLPPIAGPQAALPESMDAAAGAVSLHPSGADAGLMMHADPQGIVMEMQRQMSGLPHDSPSQSAVSIGSLNGASDSLPLLACNACGTEVNPLTAAGLATTGCPTCNSVVYCSAACAAAYRVRHERYECALRVALQSRVEALAAAEASRVLPIVEQPLPAGEVVPGAGWNTLDLHRQVLPLCISVYSGLQCNAVGSSAVRARVNLGAQRRLVHCLPPEVADTLAQWVESGVFSTLPDNVALDAGAVQMEANGVDHVAKTASSRRDTPETAAPLSAIDLLYAIFFLVRLHRDEHMESRSSSLYAERLLLRHSCEPNCVWSDVHHCILTARYICKGEELTMAVADNFPQHWPWQIRQKWFVHHHGVPCQCARCEREGRDLNDTRGALSNALVEQLLTGDILGHACPTPAHQHPTHLFHKQVQRLVEQSKLPQRNVPVLLRRLDEMRGELNKHVLPSHYLLEDLRRAIINIAEPEGHTATTTSEGQESLLFWEGMWSGAVPAKRLQIRLLPSVFECGRRRRVPPQQQRRRRRKSAVVGSGASPSPAGQDEGTDGADHLLSPSVLVSERRLGSGNRTPPPSSTRCAGIDGDDDASKMPATATPRRVTQPAPLIATKDFGSGRSIVDLFYGSYQTWYM